MKDDTDCSVKFSFFKTSYNLPVVDKGTELASIHHMKRNCDPDLLAHNKLVSLHM